MIQTASNLVAKEQFVVQIEFLSDWHIGSGMGLSGNIDRLVQRDRHNLPYIPAKTLTGIWRDACEQVAFGLDNGQIEGRWQRWVTYLFGDQPADPQRSVEKSIEPPYPAALSIRSAHFSEKLQAGLIARTKLQDVVCFLKPSIKIDTKTGCAEPDCLHVEERARGGAILSSDCMLDLPTDQMASQVAFALLVASTQFVERIGGKRRRGAGRCRCIIPNEPINSWINWIDQNRQPPEPPKPEIINKDTLSINIGEEAESESSSSWEYFDIAIDTHSPLIIANRSIGNVVESLDYIPGSNLLGLVLNRLRKSSLLDNSEILQAIDHHDFVITPATIELGGQASRPVPLCWQADKQAGGLLKGGRVYNCLVEPENSELQLKGEQGYYIGQSDGRTLPKSAKVLKGITTHNVIEDAIQRPSEAVGGVFSYEAIAPNTRFRAQLRLRSTLAHQIRKAYRDQQTNQLKATEWWSCLNGPERLGVSKKDDYGAVNVTVSKGQFHTQKANNANLYLWLLSDMLIRDQRLRFSTRPENLQQLLSKTLELEQLAESLKFKANSVTLSIIDARQQTSRRESWQCSWGLPRPSLVGIQAGSCFILRIIDDQGVNLTNTLLPHLRDKLQQLQIQGLGERTTEGYGQICFNDPLIMQQTSLLEPSQSSTAGSSGSSQVLPMLSPQESLLDIGEDGFAYACIIEREAWRDAIRQRALELAANSCTREEYLSLNSTNPPNSQLGALNSTLHLLRSLNESDQQNVLDWIDKIKKTDTRHKKWKVNDQSIALEQITTLITEPSRIWQILSPGFDLEQPQQQKIWEELTLTKSGGERLQQELWAEAIRVFVDACIRAHRREQEQETFTKPALQGVSNGTQD